MPAFVEDESVSPKVSGRSGTPRRGGGGSKEQSVLQASEFACLSFGSMSKYAPAAFCRGRVFARKGGKSLCGRFHPAGRADTVLRHSRGVCCLLFCRVCRNAGRQKPQKQPRDRRLFMHAAASPRRAGQIKTPRGRMRRRAYGAGGTALGRLSPCRKRGCRRRSSSRPDCPVRCEARRRSAGSA